MDIVKSYRCLGIEILCSGSFNTARTNLAEKAQKAMFPLNATIKQFQLSCNKSLELFHSLIRPIALYNSENLAHLTHRQIKSLEENKKSLLSCLSNTYLNRTHQKFLKFILGVKRNCSNMATLGELGEYPLILNAWVSLLSFWHRSTQMGNETFVKKASIFLAENGPGQSEWLATVEYLLKELNITTYFHNPDTVTTDRFKQICKQLLKEKFKQYWWTVINDQGSKLRFYKTFKISFEIEPYLDYVDCFQKRKVVSKFRCSDHRLEIEIGRHKKLEVEQRTCQLCRGNVETEIHVLQECPLYAKLRRIYFNDDENMNLNYILQCRNKIVANKLANFLTEAFELRKRMLDLHAYFT